MEKRDEVITECPCFGCKNLILYPTCLAFPDGIPHDIREGKNTHDEKHPEQENQITFQEIRL